MKSKLILDATIYMITPTILCNIIGIEYRVYSIIALMALVVIYTITCKQNEARVNLSGLTFSGLYMILVLLRKEVESSYQVYVYEAYLLMLAGLVVILLTVLKKNIIFRIYRDIQRAKGVNNLSIYSSVKKCGLSPIFDHLSYVISGHLALVSLVKIYSISTYGKLNYTSTQDLEILISIIFLIGELYILSKIITNMKLANKNTKNKHIKNKYKSKHSLNNSRVINLNQYKNANK